MPGDVVPADCARLRLDLATLRVADLRTTRLVDRPASPQNALARASVPIGKSVRAMDDLMKDPNVPMFTWTIPPEAPPGWGRGYVAGEKWLKENAPF